jgi:hypothetical protein
LYQSSQSQLSLTICGLLYLAAIVAYLRIGLDVLRICVVCKWITLEVTTDIKNRILMDDPTTGLFAPMYTPSVDWYTFLHWVYTPEV